MRQSKRVDEIIVVDDASTDDTEKVIAKLDSERLKYVRHAENKGVSAARNTGIDCATGDVILFVDSDDELRPSAVETLYETLTRTQPSCAGVFSHYEEQNTEGKTIKIWDVASGVITNDDLSRFLAIPTMSGSMIRSSVLETVGGFDERLALSEDADLAYRITETADLYVVDEILLNKYTDSENQLTNYDGGRNDRLIPVSENIFLEKHGEDLDTIYRMKRRIDAGFAALRSSGVEAAKQHINTAFTYAATDSERAYAFHYIGRYYAHTGDAKTASRYFKRSLQYDYFQLSAYVYLLVALFGTSFWALVRRFKHRAQIHWYRHRHRSERDSRRNRRFSSLSERR
ncbi:putative glycosyltransferase [Natronococcus occultus SP4]|uniref:Putative glycosyltransferase n=2 Tax=Natronococcus occultus TaxID=29288 RepID=L0K4I3_9EURY|nr:putative glycosyltransferase [Natronococcus occultus SP4]